MEHTEPPATVDEHEAAVFVAEQRGARSAQHSIWRRQADKKAVSYLCLPWVGFFCMGNPIAAITQAQRAGRRRVIHAFSDGCVLKDVCVLLGRWVHLRGVDEVPFTRISINKDYNADRHRDEGNARELPTAVRALNCFQKNKR